MHRVDYDRIAHLYDEPHRDHIVDRHLLTFLETRNSGVQPRILDVGCGTGKQLAANRRELPNAGMVGVDRFSGMLRLARRREPGVAWLQADGAALPLASDTFDYVTSQFSYPHVRNPKGLITGIFRVLRPGGRFVMTNIDPWSMRGWAIYRYFPEAFALDQRDFVEVESFVETMRAAGFAGMTAHRESRPHQESLQAFLTFVSARHRASQLMAIPDEAYAEGLRKLRADASDNPDGSSESEFVLATIIGDKP